MYRQQRARWGRWTKPDKLELRLLACRSSMLRVRLLRKAACVECVECVECVAKRSFLYKMCMHARPFKEHLRDVMTPGQLQSRAGTNTLRCTREPSELAYVV